MTKYLLAERIHRMLNPNISAKMHINDVMLMVQSVANSILKMEVFKVNMPEGDTIPPNCMIATYENVPVTAYKDVCQSKLPAIPVALPRNMGVYEIFDQLWCPYIPIPAGIYNVAKPHNLLGSQTGYEVYGTQVIFTKNLLPSVSSVNMRLVVSDLSTLGDYDLLPITPDMEVQIIDTVYKMLVGVPPADRQADNNSTV